MAGKPMKTNWELAELIGEAQVSYNEGYALQMAGRKGSVKALRHGNSLTRQLLTQMKKRATARKRLTGE